MMRLLLPAAALLALSFEDAHAFSRIMPAHLSHFGVQNPWFASSPMAVRSTSVVLFGAAGGGDTSGSHASSGNTGGSSISGNSGTGEENPQSPLDPNEEAKAWTQAQMANLDSTLNDEILRQLGDDATLSPTAAGKAIYYASLLSLEETDLLLRVHVIDLSKDKAYMKTISDEYNRNIKTVAGVLYKLAKKGQVKSLGLSGKSKYDSNGFTYFLEGEEVAWFYHEGKKELRACPKSVYLERVGGDLPVTYASSSGSGKTVELAGAAYVRSMDIAFYLRPGRDIDTPPQGANESRRDYVKRRTNDSVAFLQSLVRDLVERNDGVFESIKDQIVGKPKLSVVLSIDEAFRCPGLFRSVIASTDALGQVVKNELSLIGIRCPDVVFSIAGTGASRACVGSEPSKCEGTKTTASKRPTEVYESLTKDKGDPIFFPSLEYLKNNAPMLHTMAQCNARMASIVVDFIYSILISPTDATTDDRRQFLPPNEPYIVQCTMDRFMECNGLSCTLQDPLLGCKIGAQVLATHLFSKPIIVPDNQVERESMAQNLEYGIKFVDDDSESIRDLVSKYGMVVPDDFPHFCEGSNHKVLKKPFVVDDAMQLLALYLLKPGDGGSMIEPGFSGFKVASTQIVKGALAAASMVKLSEAPTVYEVLSKLDFSYMRTLPGEELKDFTDYTLMESFKRMYVSRHTSTMIWNEDLIETYRQGYPMKEQERKDVFSMKTGGPLVGLRKNRKCLSADARMMDILTSLREKSDGSGNGKLLFPFASIGYGNSPLADGYVSFFAVGAKGGDKGIHTLMLQMTDSSTADSSLPFDEILTNTNRCRSKSLSIGFGRRRLMCVAYKFDDDIRQTNKKRDYIGFTVDKSEVLGKLMGLLHEQKSLGRKSFRNYVP